MFEEKYRNEGKGEGLPGYGILYTIYRHSHGLSHEEAELKIHRLHDSQLQKRLAIKFDN